MVAKSPLRVLALSSFVARGGIGLAATTAALSSRGIETVAVPTVVLSNEPGLPAVAGSAIDPQVFQSMIEVLDANGWLSGLAAVFTGYMPSVRHVASAERAVKLVREKSAQALVVVDPISGDDPAGLYVPEDVARAIRDSLVPLADAITPNRFELAWLAGLQVDDVESAVRAAGVLPCKFVVATSIPGEHGVLANVLVTPDEVRVETVTRRAAVPHGTGDLLAGLVLAELVTGATPADALAGATRGVTQVVDASEGRDDLAIASLPKMLK